MPGVAVNARTNQTSMQFVIIIVWCSETICLPNCIVAKYNTLVVALEISFSRW